MKESPLQPAGCEVLSQWTDIAPYLGRGIRDELQKELMEMRALREEVDQSRYKFHAARAVVECILRLLCGVGTALSGKSDLPPGGKPN
jgi:hypothetical protein